jgi:hypothetical protein
MILTKIITPDAAIDVRSGSCRFFFLLKEKEKGNIVIFRCMHICTQSLYSLKTQLVHSCAVISLRKLIRKKKNSPRKSGKEQSFQELGKFTCCCRTRALHQVRYTAAECKASDRELLCFRVIVSSEKRTLDGCSQTHQWIT